MHDVWCLVLIIAALAKAPVAMCQNMVNIAPQIGVDSLSGELHFSDLAEDSILSETLNDLGNVIPNVDMSDSFPSIPHPPRFKTVGNVELGGIYGRIPYTVEGGSPWNAYSKGNVSVELLGVPVGVIFDLGTDLPVRGQRNMVRLAFDPQRAMSKDQWGRAGELQSLHTRLDSLNVERAAKFRELLGMEARLNALRSNTPHTNVPTTFPEVDTSGVIPEVSEFDLLPDPPIIPEADIDVQAKLDSMEEVLSRHQNVLDALDREVEDASMQVQRITAIVNAAKTKSGDVLTKFSQGIKHLEVGSCSPTSSEFLINGINFQGVSFEYARKDLFVAFDRGRSFDDSWQDTDPVSHELRTLQQSLFFTDADDLDPRKITAVKVGFGETKGTHFHVGYLNGTRADLPLGLTLPDETGGTLHNQVVELDLAYSINKNNLLHLVYARSVVRSSLDAGEGGTSINAVNGLFDMGGDQDQAIKLGWSSVLEQTKTHADVEARYISPFFQSFGMGFIRNGSKAVEGRLDQPLGKRLRFRGRYVLEERNVPGAMYDQAMLLQRAQAQVSYRPDRSLTLRAGYIPVHTLTAMVEGPALESRNRNFTLGGSIRKRWRTVVLVLNVDGGLYQWRSSEGVQELIGNHSIGLSILRNEQWTAQLTWTGLTGGADSSVVASDNLGVQGEYHMHSKAVVSGALQIPSGEQMGWMCALKYPVNKSMAIGVKGESYARSDLFFQDELQLDRSSTYNWTAMLTYSW